MASLKQDAPLAVEVPASKEDKPVWVKVGVIAAVGFVIGIAWPRVLGVRLGPGAPGEAAAAAAAAASASAAAAHGGRAPDAPPASVVASSATTPTVAPAASSAAATANAAASAPPNISVMKGTVVSCKTTDGETKKGKDCGAAPGVDALVTPRVRKIANCSGVEGQTGKLTLIVNADFASGRLSYDVGKTSTLQNLDAVTSCLKTAFHGTSTTATTHEHARYTVSYVATFTPGAGSTSDKDKNAKTAPPDSKEPKVDDKETPPPPTPATPTANANGGEAQVEWEVALVRDTPKTGGLVSRLPRGTKVKVGTSRDGWYQIKFGDNFANEGWVYRGAIGR